MDQEHVDEFGIRKIWDPTSKSWILAPNQQPLRSWSGPGDDELFDPSNVTMEPKNPLGEGFMAKIAAVDPHKYLAEAGGNMNAAINLMHQDLMQQGMENYAAWNAARSMIHNVMFQDQGAGQTDMSEFENRPVQGEVPQNDAWGPTTEHPEDFNPAQTPQTDMSQFENRPTTDEMPPNVMSTDDLLGALDYSDPEQKPIPTQYFDAAMEIAKKNPGIQQPQLTAMLQQQLHMDPQEAQELAQHIVYSQEDVNDPYTNNQSFWSKVYVPGHTDGCMCKDCKFQHDQEMDPVVKPHMDPFPQREPKRDWTRTDDSFPSMLSKIAWTDRPGWQQPQQGGHPWPSVNNGPPAPSQWDALEGELTCPNCRHTMYDNEQVCPHCNQPLDWSMAHAAKTAYDFNAAPTADQMQNDLMNKVPWYINKGGVIFGEPGGNHSMISSYAPDLAAGNTYADGHIAGGENKIYKTVHGFSPAQVNTMVGHAYERHRATNPTLPPFTGKVTIGEPMRPKQFTSVLHEQLYADANLDDCPECQGVMMDKNGEKQCSDCGHKQTVIHTESKTAQGPLLPLEIGALGDLAGGAAGGLAEAAGAAGGAAAGGAEAGGVGYAGSLMNGALNAGKGVGNLMTQPGLAGSVARHEMLNTVLPGDKGDGGAPQDASQAPPITSEPIATPLAANYGPAKFVREKKEAHPEQYCPKCMWHTNPDAQPGDTPQPCSRHGGSTTAAMWTAGFEEEIGGATKNRGNDVDPSIGGTGGHTDRVGDSPDLLKDVNDDQGGGGPDAGESGTAGGGAGQSHALQMFELALPLVMHFNDSDESGADNPVLQAIDKMLDEEFPGYKDQVGAAHTVDPSVESPSDPSDDKGEPKREKDEPSKESNVTQLGTIWSVNQQNLPGQQMQPQQQQQAPAQMNNPAGNVDGQPQMPCPICGGSHDPALAHGQMDQNQLSGFGGQPFMSKLQQIESRRPKLCPYHSELVDYSIQTGDPISARSTIRPSDFGDNHCKSGQYGSNCSFKPDMVTSEYWDAKNQIQEQRVEQMQQPEFVENQFQAEEPAPTPMADMNQDSIPESDPETGVLYQMDGWAQDTSGGDTAVGAPMEMAASVTSGMPGHKDGCGCFGCAASGGNTSDQDETSDELDDKEAKTALLDGFNDSTHMIAQTPWNDFKGSPLVEGQTYTMKSPKFNVPEEITVDKITPEKIEVTVHGDLGMDYKEQLTPELLDTQQYQFEPQAREQEQVEQFSPETNNDAPVGDYQTFGPDDLSSPSEAITGGSGEHEGVDPGVLAKLAGKDYTPSQQRAFIDEEGTARNIDDLDIAGTHYESHFDHDLDSEILWGF